MLKLPLPANAAQGVAPIASTVAALLQAPEVPSYQVAKFTLDELMGSKIVVPNPILERLVDAARQMAGPNPSDPYKLAAVRKAIYEPGPWNYGRAFSYDLEDPLGQSLRSHLLSTYIETRKGNCVSMPLLFLIIADRLGLKVSLASAPLHIFVRYTDSAGGEHNLETTSGGRATRDDWYRQNLPMSDKAVTNGIYMRTLSKRESIAVMAGTILQYLIEKRRFSEAIDVANSIIKTNPRDTHAMVKMGSAYAGLLDQEFINKYPTPASIPPVLRPRYQMLAQQNEKLFRDAEAMGWKADLKNSDQ